MGILNSIKSAFTGGAQNKKSASPVDLAHALGGYSYDSYSGVSVSDMRALQTSAVFGCIRVLSESIGMLPCTLYSNDENGNKQKATKEKLYNLLNFMPNSYMTPQEFWELLVACLCLRGNFYAYKVKALGEVVELLPLEPGCVTPELNNNWEPEYRVTFPDGTQSTLGQDDIWHVRIFTLDGLVGLTPIGYARNSIGLNIATEQHGAALFKNGARPSGILKTEQELNDAAFERLRSDFSNNYEGNNASFKTMILEMGLDWKPITMTSEDAQFLETRKFGIQEICRIFRVPPHMVQDLDKATFSNIEHLGLSFVNYTLVPYLTRIEQRINIGLVSKKKHGKLYSKFNTGALLRGDMKSRFEAYATGINWGIYSPNDCRELEDLNRREGGDDYLTPLNMVKDTDENEKQN